MVSKVKNIQFNFTKKFELGHEMLIDKFPKQIYPTYIIGFRLFNSYCYYQPAVLQFTTQRFYFLTTIATNISTRGNYDSLNFLQLCSRSKRISKSENKES